VAVPDGEGKFSNKDTTGATSLTGVNRMNTDNHQRATIPKLLRTEVRSPVARDRSMRIRNTIAVLLTVFACSAMVGDVFHLRALKGIGAASALAPFPKVFCDNQGLEGFASEFTITAEGKSGITNIMLTPEIYSGLKGPYNRRNVYGAALAFGPKLPPEVWRSVFVYGLGPDGPLREELRLPVDSTNVMVRIRTKTAGRRDEWVLEDR